MLWVVAAGYGGGILIALIIRYRRKHDSPDEPAM